MALGDPWKLMAVLAGEGRVRDFGDETSVQDGRMLLRSDDFAECGAREPYV
ncbi:MAG: hypothetical protein MK165_12650 [Pirellulaceae bacterium]|nr:hypothetical protein [Pirellulaceae bacterium]